MTHKAFIDDLTETEEYEQREQTDDCTGCDELTRLGVFVLL